MAEINDSFGTASRLSSIRLSSVFSNAEALES